jgi:hypothetical protein
MIITVSSCATLVSVEPQCQHLLLHLLTLLQLHLSLLLLLLIGTAAAAVSAQH